MAATKIDIRRWLSTGKDNAATHMIVVCDMFDWEDYPVYVFAGQNPRDIAQGYDGPNHQKLMEVYALHLDIESQLNEHRAFHYEGP